MSRLPQGRSVIGSFHSIVLSMSSSATALNHSRFRVLSHIAVESLMSIETWIRVDEPVVVLQISMGFTMHVAPVVGLVPEFTFL